MKKILKIISILLFLCLTLTFKVEASAVDYVYLGGDSIGIKMNTGVYVVGKYQVATNEGKVCPWKNANIEVGDKINSINGIKVQTNLELLDYLAKCDHKEVKLELTRNNKNIQTSLTVLQNVNNENTLGLYIRDQILGIGTITFVTEDQYFGSLGHGVYENKVLVDSSSGNLFYSNVSSIKKAEPGIAGEKRATINSQVIGKILTNDVTGLYGKINNISDFNKKIKVGNQKEIKKGKATIYTCLENNVVRAYEIEILDVDWQNSKATKGIHFKVTDEDLLSKTGGIIQGMSGSPIVQNNKIIGAVSHVTVENPLYGYGMHIEWMLDEVAKIN